MRKRICSAVLAACLILLQVNCMTVSASARTDFKPALPLRQSYHIISLDYYQESFSGSAHTGIDIDHNGHKTQDVYAVADGTVVLAKNLCGHHNGYPHNEKSCKAGN